MKIYDGYKWVTREVTGNAVYRYQLTINPTDAMALIEEMNRDYGAVIEHWLEHNGRRIRYVAGDYGTEDYLETYYD